MCFSLQEVDLALWARKTGGSRSWADAALDAAAIMAVGEVRVRAPRTWGWLRWRTEVRGATRQAARAPDRWRGAVPEDACMRGRSCIKPAAAQTRVLAGARLQHTGAAWCSAPGMCAQRDAALSARAAAGAAAVHRRRLGGAAAERVPAQGAPAGVPARPVLGRVHAVDGRSAVTAMFYAAVSPAGEVTLPATRCPCEQLSLASGGPARQRVSQEQERVPGSR